jgi:hypothetical protein
LTTPPDFDLRSWVAQLLAKELKDMHALAVALGWATGLAAIECNSAEVDRLASDLIELSTRHNFLHWQAIGAIHRGWARSVSGDTAEGIAWIERGIEDYRATGWVLGLPYHLAQKAEVFFSRLWVLRRPKLRLRFAKRSESQRSRSRFHWRNALKLPTQNIAAKKWVQWENMESDYLFGNAQSRKCVFLLLVLILLNGRQVTISG